jgi:hypothetical protein
MIVGRKCQPALIYVICVAAAIIALSLILVFVRGIQQKSSPPSSSGFPFHQQE